MIVFYGRGDDEPLALAVSAAREISADHLLVDQGRLAEVDVVLGTAATAALDGWLRVDGRSVPLAAVTGVYARPLDPRLGCGDDASRARVAAFHQAFLDWLEVTPALVVNRPYAMESNASKPYQSQLVARAGFLVPETLVTTDPDEVRAFLALHRRVVYKSTSGVRSVVRELTGADEPRLDLVQGLPTQFQAYVPGQDVRVHVVGGQTYATLVESDAVDYRYAGRDGRSAVLSPFELPSGVADRCARLAGMLGLPFAGIDLRRRPDGAWVCFEVNPMPAYSYYEAQTGLEISAALVRLLLGGSREEPRSPTGA